MGPRSGPLRGPKTAQPPKGPVNVSLLDSGLSIDIGREAFGPGDYNALCFGRTRFWIFFFFLVFLITLKNDQKELLQLNSLAGIAR